MRPALLRRSEAWGRAAGAKSLLVLSRLDQRRAPERFPRTLSGKPYEDRDKQFSCLPTGKSPELQRPHRGRIFSRRRALFKPFPEQLLFLFVNRRIFYRLIEGIAVAGRFHQLAPFPAGLADDQVQRVRLLRIRRHLRLPDQG